MPDAAMFSTHGSILDDLGLSPEEATALKFKAELYQAVFMVAKKYSQKEPRWGLLVVPFPGTACAV